MNHWLKKSLLIVPAISLLVIFVCLALVLSNKRFIVDDTAVENAPVAIIFGARVKSNGQPSDILRDRLLTGIDLYDRGIVDKLLLSGDNGQVEYDELNAMRLFVLSYVWYELN